MKNLPQQKKERFIKIIRLLPTFILAMSSIFSIDKNEEGQLIFSFDLPAFIITSDQIFDFVKGIVIILFCVIPFVLKWLTKSTVDLDRDNLLDIISCQATIVGCITLGVSQAFIVDGSWFPRSLAILLCIGIVYRQIIQMLHIYGSTLDDSH